MPILGERFYQMSNAIFCYDLKPIPLAVYNWSEGSVLAQHQDHRTVLQLFRKRRAGCGQAISGSRIHPQGGN